MSPGHGISLANRTRHPHLQKIPAARKIPVFNEKGLTTAPDVLNPSRAKIQIQKREKAVLMMRLRKPNLNGHLPSNGTTEEAGRKRGLLRSRPMILTASKVPADIVEITVLP
jgi:hypothetical protein